MGYYWVALMLIITIIMIPIRTTTDNVVSLNSTPVKMALANPKYNIVSIMVLMNIIPPELVYIIPDAYYR